MVKYFLIILLFYSQLSLAKDCNSYLKSDPSLCQISKRYQKLKSIYKNKYGVDIEYLTRYRALRFIKEDDWEARSKGLSCAPWNFYPPRPKTWVFWERGAERTKDLVKRFRKSRKGQSITIKKSLLTDLHRHTIDESLLGLMPKLKGAGAGVLRDSKTLMRPGFTVSCADKDIDEKALKVLKDYDLKDKNGEPLVSIALGDSANLKCSNDFYAGVVQYMDSELVKDELDKMITVTNKKLKNIKNGNGQKENALDVVANIQRWFISIHPFGDGNGRTSRFLQDYLLESLELPYLPSGALQFDVFKSQEDYQKEVTDRMKDSMEYFETCLEEYKSAKDLKNLSCDCRPLYVGDGDFDSTFDKEQDQSEKERLNCQKMNQSIMLEDQAKGFENILIWMMDNDIYEDDDL